MKKERNILKVAKKIMVTLHFHFIFEIQTPQLYSESLLKWNFLAVAVATQNTLTPIKMTFLRRQCVFSAALQLCTLFLASSFTTISFIVILKTRKSNI